MAVVKMFPDVRSAVAHSGNRVFLGPTSCHTFDRFWARIGAQQRIPLLHAIFVLAPLIVRVS